MKRARGKAVWGWGSEEGKLGKFESETKKRKTTKRMRA